jgi:peptide/nickel transport system permease protein
MPSKALRASLALFVLLVGLPVFLHFLSLPRAPLELARHAPYASPSWAAPLGSDELGRDLLGRALMAGSLSLAVAVGAVLSAWGLAVSFGSLAAWRPGSLLAGSVGYFVDLLQTIPFIVLAVALAAVFRPGFIGIALLMGVVASAAPARLVSAELRRARSARHVTAQIALGHPPFLLFRTAFLPNLALPPAIWLLLLLPELLTVDAGLSLFGLGAQPPIPSLGRMIYDGLNQAQAGWWLPSAPLLVLLFLVVTAHFVASYLRKLVPGNL